MKKIRGQRFNIHVDNELKEIFVGHHTLFSVIGFVVGGILVGETVKEILYMYVGHTWTLIIGLVLLILTGVILHKFSDSKKTDNKDFNEII